MLSDNYPDNLLSGFIRISVSIPSGLLCLLELCVATFGQEREVMLSKLFKLVSKQVSREFT